MNEKEFARAHPQLALFLNARGLKFFSSRQPLWSVGEGKNERVFDAPKHAEGKRVFFIGDALEPKKANALKLALYERVEQHNDSEQGMRVKHFAVTNDIPIAGKDFVRVRFELAPRE